MTRTHYAEPRTGRAACGTSLDHPVTARPEEVSCRRCLTYLTTFANVTPLRLDKIEAPG